LDVLNLAGNYVTGVALANWVPGDIYLPAGESAPARKSLQLERPEDREKILKEAKGYFYHYTVNRIQFEAEEEINFTESPIAVKQKPAKVETVIAKPKKTNLNQANPELCTANQVTIETAEQYYPGSKCTHVEQNIDSERFKQEYIRLCQKETQAASAPPSAVQVQLSSCMPAPSGRGIVYKKRICCNWP